MTSQKFNVIVPNEFVGKLVFKAL